MTMLERRTGAVLAGIYGLRMMGLFILLPVLAVYANGLPGGQNLAMVGLVMGAYGLTQALLQIPFGIASDRFGRKPVILIGLLIFAIGSLLGAHADSLATLALARTVQGAGAVSAAISAMAADLTREQHRTKIMAMIGSTIGLMFAASLVLSPVLYHHLGMAGLFWFTAGLVLCAMLVLIYLVPSPPRNSGNKVHFRQVLADSRLQALSFGVFSLHALQMAMFVALPVNLVKIAGIPLAGHWKIYLPVVLASFLIMVPTIVIGEQRQQILRVYRLAIGVLIASQILLATIGNSLAGIIVTLLVFFIAFNVLEACLPSLVSRYAPPVAKGAAMGIYNTAQSMGVFVGGAAGGWLIHHNSTASLALCTAALAVIWLLVALTMPKLPQIAELELPLASTENWPSLRNAMMELVGVREAIILEDARVARVKVNLDNWDEPGLMKLIGG